MKHQPHTKDTFNLTNSKPAKAEDLFLPSVVEVVRHMARMAAERDYKHFLATGEIMYSDPTKEGQDD